jgi:hypothetical protein
MVICNWNIAKATDCEPTNCGPWGANQVENYVDPRWPDCNIQIYYQTRICDGVTNYQLIAVSCDWDETQNPPPCSDFLTWVCPSGINNWADEGRLRYLWNKFLENEMTQMMQSYPGCLCKNNCKHQIKTITSGGCVAAWSAYRQPTISYPRTTMHFMLAPCVENGCCILTISSCWDGGTDPVTTTDTQYILPQGTDCSLLQTTIYNPFKDYSTDWIIIGPGPCYQTCYIDN